MSNGFTRMECSTSYNLIDNTETKQQQMKRLIAAVEDYSKDKTEETALVINNYLKLLSMTIDQSIFDPHTSIAANFFASLYELMTKMESRSAMAWYSVDVLMNACKNSSARHALINTYQFIPSLARLLGDHLTVEKKVRLLKLMQDLTCGIKISWQIPHLSHLMLTLTKWVESQDEDIVTLSLGVLVNLCYRNLPAIYTLSRHVDIKRFLRICMPLQGPIIEVYTCKLLIILDFMNGDMPTDTLIKLVETTFKSILQAYALKDVILLRQIVEFFLDYKKQNINQKTLNEYRFYERDLKLLLELIDDTSDNNESVGDPDCMAVVFSFIHSLLNHTPTLYPQLIQLALKWIQTDAVSATALSVLRTIAINIPESDSNILEPLILGLPIFLLALNTNHGDEDIKTNTEYNKSLSALMELLRAMLRVDSIRNVVLMELKEDMLHRIFVPLLTDGSSPRANDCNTSSTEAVNLYIHVIALINELTKYDSSWINLQSSLMQNRQIHMVLAQALYQSPEEVKSLVLEIATMPGFPSRLIGSALGTLQSVAMVDEPSKAVSTNNSNYLGAPMLSLAQIERLDTTLNRLKAIIAENNASHIFTSDVMELYEYKLASMSHAERAAIISMETASERCTFLQHRTAQLTAELHRLHQLFFHSQQCQEQGVRSIEYLREQCKELTNTADTEKGRYKACSSQLTQKEKALAHCEKILEETNKQLIEANTSRMQLEEHNNGLMQAVHKLEESCTKLEKNLQKKDEQCKKAAGNIENLKTQIYELEMCLKKKDEEVQMKVAELKDVTRELMARKQIIDTITKVANSQLL